MATTHIVSYGECLWRIARKYGIPKWRTIYDHPKNAGFRQKRPNPNLIYPGDAIWIPDPQQDKKESCATDQRHTFKLSCLLQFVEFDDHFAPGKEEMVISYELRNLAKHEVTLEITSDHYSSNPIWKATLTDEQKTNGEHKLEWDGKTTCGGPLAGTYINPLYGPYKITLKADNGVKDEGEFRILFHSIKLRLGSYTEDGKAPPESDAVKWVQYKLNELGYFSGPVDGAKGPQTKRAIKRYTYTMPGQAETDSHTSTAFKDALRANLHKRTILPDAKAIAKSRDAKLFLDHDYFYHGTTDFSNWISPQGHGDKDKDKLDRYEIPLHVQAYLVHKRDPDGTGTGREAPLAIGKAEIEWFMEDPPEDTSILPTPTASVPSHGKAYVEKALQAKAGNWGDAKDPKDNAPTANYGARGKPVDHFRIGTKLPPFKSRKAGQRIFSEFNLDETKPDKLGHTGILFRGSYVAGDNWRIKAKLSFDKAGGKDRLVKAHEDFFGKKFDEVFEVKTGVLTLWRRHHLSMDVYWPRPKVFTAWNEVATEYARAHVELDTAGQNKEINDLLSTTALKNEYLQLVVNHNPGKSLADLKFEDQGMYAFKDMPSQGFTQSPDDYKTAVRNLVSTFIEADDYKFLLSVGNWFRKKIAATREPGLGTVYANFCKPVKVHKMIPLLGIKNIFSYEDWVPSILCIGLPEGVSIISNPMAEDEQDRFLIAHETGHTRYLTHHEIANDGTSDVGDDHDMGERNCIMCYPDRIQSRPGLNWNRGAPEQPRFCGKCILKLRGWKVHSGGLPAQH